MAEGYTNDLTKFEIKYAKPHTGTELGRGFFGTVFEIEAGSHGLCAGKAIYDILLGSDLWVSSKYLRECQIMSELNHPNITKFIGVCNLKSLSSFPVLLMEKLDQNLDDYLKKSQETNFDIPLARKISILQDVARGLVYLHDRHPPIIHRDLTSKNVLLTKELKAKIADFGNFRIVDLLPEQLLKVTPYHDPGMRTLVTVFMPPEAFVEGTPYAPSLDIFSFGHLALHVALQIIPSDILEENYTDQNTGKLTRRSEVERRGLYLKQLETHKQFQIGKQDEEYVLHPLVGTIMKCLDDDPNKRYNSNELLAALQEMSILDIEASLHEVIERWNKKGMRTDPIVLVVAGKAGVGKSTLVNNFLGLKDKKKKKGKKSKRAKTAVGGEGITTEVGEFIKEVNGITVKIIDTPGLDEIDPSDTEARVAGAFAMLNAYTNDGKADLLLYCITMKGGRVGKEDVRIIKTLTNKFSDKIWEHCVLVMTNADSVLHDLEDSDNEDSDSEDSDIKDSDSEEEIESFEGAIGSFCNKFQQALVKAGVTTISSIHNGLFVDNEIPSPSTIITVPVGKRKKKPLQWKEILFREVLKKCNEDAIPAMLALEGMTWKQIVYILTMPLFFVRGTNFTLETTNEASRHVKPVRKLISARRDYATIVEARKKVSQQRIKEKQEEDGQLQASAKFYVPTPVQNKVETE